MCGLDGVQRANYFRGKMIERGEIVVKVGKLKKGDHAGKDVVNREMIKGGLLRCVEGED